MFRRALLLAWLPLCLACPRPSLPETEEDAEAPEIESVMVFPFRRQFTYVDGMPGLLRAFDGDLLEVKGKGWTTDLVRLTVGGVDVPLDSSSTSIQLLAVIPSGMTGGVVRVVEGDQSATGASIQVLGPGHVENMRSRGLVEPQVAVSHVMAASPFCQDPPGVENGLCELALGVRGVVFNFGPVVNPQTPAFVGVAGPGYIPSVRITPLADTNVGQADTAVTVESVRPFLKAEHNADGGTSGASQELAWISLAGPANADGGVDVPTRKRLTLGLSSMGLPLSVKGPLQMRHPTKDGPGGYAVAIDAPHEDGTGVYSLALFRTDVEGVAREQERDDLRQLGTPAAVGLLQLTAVQAPEGSAGMDGGMEPGADGGVASSADPVLAVFKCMVHGDNMRSRMDLWRLGPTPEEVRVIAADSPVYGCNSICNAYRLEADGGFMEITRVPPGNLRGVEMWERDVVVVLPLDKDVGPYPVNEHGCVLRHVYATGDESDTWAEFASFAGQGSLSAAATWRQDKMLFSIPDRGGFNHASTVDRYLYWSSDSRNGANSLQAGGVLASDSIATPTAYRLLRADVDGMRVLAVPVTGARFDVLDVRASQVSSQGVLGAPVDAWPAAIPGMVAAVHESAMVLMDSLGVVHGFDLSQLPVSVALDVDPAAGVTQVASMAFTWDGIQERAMVRISTRTVGDDGFKENTVEWEAVMDNQFPLPVAMDADHLVVFDPGDAEGPCVQAYMREGWARQVNSVGFSWGQLVNIRRTQPVANRELRVLPAGCGAAVLALERTHHKLYARTLYDENYNPTPIQTRVYRLGEDGLPRTLPQPVWPLVGLPTGAALGLVRSSEGVPLTLSCVQDDDTTIILLMPAPFANGEMVLSPDGRRLMVGVEHALLEFSVSLETSAGGCPSAVTVVSSMPVEGTPQRMRFDAGGRRLVWTDPTSQKIGWVD